VRCRTYRCVAVHYNPCPVALRQQSAEPTRNSKARSEAGQRRTSRVYRRPSYKAFAEETWFSHWAYFSRLR
jgi:hypothetical protein